MSDMCSVRETAHRWNIPEERVTYYCRKNRIVGAQKNGGVWMIPADATRPADMRGRKKGSAPAITGTPRKPMPIGVSSYRDACTHYYYVDKTMMIKEFLDERPKVSLFTRPRRFGKTLNMDMFRTFFEISDEDTSIYFQDKKIWSCGEYYRSFQGKYPVIYLSFKDVKCDTWEETYRYVVENIRAEYLRHRELATSDKVTILGQYNKIADNIADERDYAFSLKYLSQMLREHYGIAPILIIDEYDTPIQEGYAKDFYNKIITFMRNLFSGGLKDNDINLSFGFLTGILRVAKESIFSGLNNLKINSILDEKYSSCFGFTADEVRQMAQDWGVSDKYDEICQWYDGYRFGSTEIFNPWSVINYFGNSCIPGHFWENTSSNPVINRVLEEADGETLENLNCLLQGNTITTFVDTNVIYPQIRNNPASVYSFLLVCGYLKTWEAGMSTSGDYLCKLSLPNKEIALVYRKEIIAQLSSVVPHSATVGIQSALVSNNAVALQKHLRRFLLESVSFYDTVNENSYHMLLLGLCAVLSDRYYLSSNREAGEGRYDIMLKPKISTMPGIVIEVKVAKDLAQIALQALADKALVQIDEQGYEAELKKDGIDRIIKYGVAFSGKQVAITSVDTDKSEL